jgi:hypothetical protein
MLKKLLHEYRNTLFVNFTQFDDFLKSNPRTDVEVVATMHIPVGQVMYIDEDGGVRIYKMDEVGL